MRAAVIGGGLQGVEAVYLAHKAGWEVVLIDRRAAPPASGLCDTFVQLDVTQIEQLKTALGNVDIVIPATENEEALDSLVRWSKTTTIPLAFDPHAYSISSSKLKSDKLFAEIGIPAPAPWPDCRFPVIAKPSGESGSRGVQLFNNLRQLEEQFGNMLPPQGWVLQEYLEGPSYSLEVIGAPGNYTAVQVTDLEMDALYDCKRVTAPTLLSPELVLQFEKISLHIAESIRLKGIMDVEVILHNGRLKVLEIDARLPSQTPTAVYWSIGRNMLEMIAPTVSVSPTPFLKVAGDQSGSREMAPGLDRLRTPSASVAKAVIYEHIKVTPGQIEECGEHIISQAGPLRLHKNLFGADEAITDYEPGRNQWVATLIITGAERAEARDKRNKVIEEIKKKVNVNVKEMEESSP